MNRRVKVRRDLFAILEGVVYPMGWSVTCPCCAGRPMFTASNWKSAMANAIIHAEAHASEHAEEPREFASMVRDVQEGAGESPAVVYGRP